MENKEFRFNRKWCTWVQKNISKIFNASKSDYSKIETLEVELLKDKDDSNNYKNRIITYYNVNSNSSTNINPDDFTKIDISINKISEIMSKENIIKDHDEVLTASKRVLNAKDRINAAAYKIRSLDSTSINSDLISDAIKNVTDSIESVNKATKNSSTSISSSITK